MKPNGKGSVAVKDPAEIRWPLIKELTLEKLFKRRLDAVADAAKKNGQGNGASS